MRSLSEIARDMHEQAERNLFRAGIFTSHSDHLLSWKVECDALTDDDLECLTAVGSKLLPETFSRVYGIPRGGVRIAKAMERFIDPRSSYLLIVDDVLTTGRSMHEAYEASIGNVMGLVLFARGPVPDWVTAVWNLGGDVR